ncbi:MAG: hypothetical protein ACOYB2_19710 [Limnohabitans sp.]
MKLGGGTVDAVSVTGFTAGKPLSLVRMTATGEDPTGIEEPEGTNRTVVLWMRPAEARKIGMGMIGAAFASVADSEMRAIAKRLGIDGDAMIEAFRVRTDEELP